MYTPWGLDYDSSGERYTPEGTDATVSPQLRHWSQPRRDLSPGHQTLLLGSALKLACAEHHGRKATTFGPVYRVRRTSARGTRHPQPADPQFKGLIPRAFPFSDDEIKARKIGLSTILTRHCEAYSPAEGSPLIGAGDPADGAGTNIGAVGAARPSDQDRFGRFGSK